MHIHIHPTGCVHLGFLNMGASPFRNVGPLGNDKKKTPMSCPQGEFSRLIRLVMAQNRP